EREAGQPARGAHPDRRTDQGQQQDLYARPYGGLLLYEPRVVSVVQGHRASSGRVTESIKAATLCAARAPLGTRAGSRSFRRTSMNRTARAFWLDSPGRGEIREFTLPAP